MAVILSVAFAPAGEAMVGISQPVAAEPEYQEGEILVRLKGGRARSLPSWARARLGASRTRAFKSVPNLHMVTLPAGLSTRQALDAVRGDADVLYAEPNYVVRAQAVPNDVKFNRQWSLRNVGQNDGTPGADIDAPAAWDITTGSAAVVVAIIDTGINYEHADLAGRVFRNESDCDFDDADDDGNGYADDCHGIDMRNDDGDPADDATPRHGTHVAGTIGAAANDGAGVAGVDWNVRLMACKFLNRRGQGTTADAIRCLDYIAMMKTRGVNIVATNNSWGGGGYSQGLNDAIAAQRALDILFIAAAGNAASNNDQVPIFPASFWQPNVIAVAATTRTDALADFSNFGRATVHLGAPGHEILSTTATGEHEDLSGTSMATPHVTGVAALLKAQDPGRDWRAIKNLLLAGGEVIPALDDTITGRRLNALGALTCSDVTVLARLRPVAASVNAAVGSSVALAVQHNTCGVSAGPVAVEVQPDGAVLTLVDDGSGSDQAAGDGIASGEWTPATPGIYTLEIAGGDTVTVHVGTDVLLGPGGRDSDQLGVAIAVDGSTAIVGASTDDTAGPNAGSAHQYNLATRTLTRTYLPPAGGGGAFGYAIAADAGTVLIGAPSADVSAPDAGAAYLYDLATGSLVYSFMNPSTRDRTGDEFGWAVALVGNVAAIGAPWSEDGPRNDEGRVYLYDRASGALLLTLTVPVPSEVGGSHFGFSFAAIGTDLLVGAAGASTVIGRVYRIDAEPTSPSFGAVRQTYQAPQTSLTPVQFGHAIAVAGSHVAVGDPWGSGPPFSGTGLTGNVHIFDADSGAPEHVLYPVDPGDVNPDYFGWSLAAVGDLLLIGAPEINHGDPVDDEGAIYGYDPDTAELRTAQRRPWPEYNSWFGFALGVFGNELLVGAPFDDAAAFDAGAVYLVPALPRCGDGVLLTDLGETCDDGNLLNGDGCSAVCQAEFCGDGTVNNGEECDDGGAASGDGCSDICVVEYCGDGIVNNGSSEECDDGNGTNGDGCSTSCEHDGPQNKDQQKCIMSLNRNLAKVSKAQARDTAGCLEEAAKGRLIGTIEACLLADDRGRVLKAQNKTAAHAAKHCTGVFPAFGSTDAATVGQVGVGQTNALVHQIFGPDLDVAVSANSTGRCQAELTAVALDCHLERLRAFNLCKRDGLKGIGQPTIRRAVELAACLDADPVGKVARACDATSGDVPAAIARDCPLLTPDIASGCAAATAGDLAQCLERIGRCRACRTINAADALSRDCELFDDGAANGTCP